MHFPIVVLYIFSITYFCNFRKQLTEEEQDNLEICELFPSYQESDFGDLEGNLSLEDTCKVKENKSSSKATVLTNDDIEDICHLHSTVVRENVDTHWICGVFNGENYVDHMSCFSARMQLFHDTVVGNHLACTKELDENSFVALYLSLDMPKSASYKSNEKSEKLYDFYRDSNVEEVRKCLPLLKVTTSRVAELILEWPDHPTLNKVSFSINHFFWNN